MINIILNVNYKYKYFNLINLYNPKYLIPIYIYNTKNKYKYKYK